MTPKGKYSVLLKILVYTNILTTQEVMLIMKLTMTYRINTSVWRNVWYDKHNIETRDKEMEKARTI
jgi:hypothetical protein